MIRRRGCWTAFGPTQTNPTLSFGGPMQSTTIIVKNKVGLHARPASLFVKSAMAHTAAITVTKGEKSGNAKSILGILSLGVHQDDEITISADGPDEAEAVAALIQLINDNFGEPIAG